MSEFQSKVDAAKGIIDDHGLQFLMNFDLDQDVVAEALQQLAYEWGRDDE